MGLQDGSRTLSTSLPFVNFSIHFKQICWRSYLGSSPEFALNDSHTDRTNGNAREAMGAILTDAVIFEKVGRGAD